LLPESGNIRSPLPDSGEHFWPDSVKLAGFRSDSSGSGRIWLDPYHFGQILAIFAISGKLLTMARFWPVSAGIISAGIRRQWLDVAGFRRCLDSDIISAGIR
jgi:hypothetical protein